MLNENIMEIECCICMETVPIELSIKISICHHIFCKSCLKRWMIESATCPKDNKKLNQIFVFNSHLKIFKEISFTKFFYNQMMEDCKTMIINHLQTIITNLVPITNCLKEMYLWTRNLIIFQDKFDRNKFQSILISFQDDCISDYINSLISIGKYYNPIFNKYQNQFQFDEETVERNIEMINLVLKKYFNKDSCLLKYISELKLIETIYKMFFQINLNFQTVKEFFDNIPKTNVLIIKNKLYKSYLVRSIYERIENIIKLSRNTEEIKCIKSVILTITIKEKYYQIFNSWPQIVEQCIICSGINKKTNFIYSQYSNEVLCEECQEKYYFNTELLTNKTIEQIEKVLLDQYRQLFTKIFRHITKTLNLTKKNLQLFSNEDNSYILKFSHKPFFLICKESADSLESFKYLQNRLSVLRNTYKCDFQRKTDHVVGIFMEIFDFYNRFLKSVNGKLKHLANGEKAIVQDPNSVNKIVRKMNEEMKEQFIILSVEVSKITESVKAKHLPKEIYNNLTELKEYLSIN